jgi:ketosteroid isomerase-like protein
VNRHDDVRARLETFFAALGARDADAAMACYAPGARLEVVAPGPFGGEHVASREGLQAFFRTISEIRFEILGLIVDGNRVAVEVASTGRLVDGKPYRNRYHDYFELEDGQITVFREYPTFPTPA